MPLQASERLRKPAAELLETCLGKKEDREKEEVSKKEEKSIDHLSKIMKKRLSSLEKEIKEIKDLLKTIVVKEAKESVIEIVEETTTVEKEPLSLSGQSIFAIQPVVSVASSELSTGSFSKP